MGDDRPFFVAGLWSDAPGPSTGEIADSYTMIIGEANAAMRVHDRMPDILGTGAARRWLEPGPLPAELLVPHPAEEMQAWRVSDAAKSSRIEPIRGWRSPSRVLADHLAAARTLAKSSSPFAPARFAGRHLRPELPMQPEAAAGKNGEVIGRSQCRHRLPGAFSSELPHLEPPVNCGRRSRFSLGVPPAPQRAAFLLCAAQMSPQQGRG